MKTLQPEELYQAMGEYGFRFTRWGRDARWPDGHHLSRANMRALIGDFTLWFFFQGKGELLDHRSGKRYPLRAGICLCMTPGMDLEVWQGQDNPLGDTFIHFDIIKGDAKHPPDAWPIAPFYTEVDNVAYTDQLTRSILAILNRCRRTGTSEVRHATLEAELLLKGLFMQLYHINTQAPEDPLERRHELAIAKMLDELYECPQRFRSVQSLSAMSGYSSSHLRALCVRITGETPGQHLIKARMETAKRYLRTTDESVGGIAEVLGYENIFYFSRQFRKNVGMTAMAYRREASRKRD